MFNNGGRALLIAFVYFLGSIAILGAVLLYGLVFDREKFAPLEDHSPGIVHNAVVAAGDPIEPDAGGAVHPLKNRGVR
jgi:hypothetical protein